MGGNNAPETHPPPGFLESTPPDISAPKDNEQAAPPKAPPHTPDNAFSRAWRYGPSRRGEIGDHRRSVEVGFLSPRSGSRFWHNIESRVETMHREQDLSTPTRPAQGFPQPGFVSKTDKTDRPFRNGASRRVCYGSGCLEDAKTLKTDDRTQAPSKTDKTYNSFSHHRFFRIYRREGPRTEPGALPKCGDQPGVPVIEGECATTITERIV